MVGTGVFNDDKLAQVRESFELYDKDRNGERGVQRAGPEALRGAAGGANEALPPDRFSDKLELMRIRGRSGPVSTR